MRILVIDNTKKHLDAALQTLIGHEVTTCSTYDEADNLLEKKYVNEKGEKCWAFNEGAKEASYWDVVLCDLLMPAGRKAQGSRGQKYVGQEMPVGWSLALVAAKNGAKYVAVVTDLNHHEHPASAMLDNLQYGIMKINDAKVVFDNNGHMVKLADSEKEGKDWGHILNRLLEED